MSTGSSARLMLFVLCTALMVFTGAGPSHAVEAGAPSSVDISNANTLGLLSAARDALYRLDHPQPQDGAGQPRIYFDAAAESLTGLYQLHGCLWAKPALRGLYARADAPALRLGYSVDGRVLLRVEPLELKNPAFHDYTVILCTLTSETARSIHDAGHGALRLTLPSGVKLSAQQADAQHPLWKQLSRQVSQFRPIKDLPSGAGVDFKQLYAVPNAGLPLNACAVELDWGGYQFELPRWTSSTPQEAGRG